MLPPFADHAMRGAAFGAFLGGSIAAVGWFVRQRDASPVDLGVPAPNLMARHRALAESLLHFTAVSAAAKPSILASLRAAATPLNGGSSGERAAPVSRPANPATASSRSCAESSSCHGRVPGHECPSPPRDAPAPSPPRDAPASTPGAAEEGVYTLAAAAAEAETDKAWWRSSSQVQYASSARLCMRRIGGAR